MKKIFLIILFLIAVNGISYAQNPVMDTHPTATIFAIDYQSGQEVAATSGDAILFKDALIELVSNTNTSKMQLTKVVPGRKSFVITQMDPQSNGYAYQLILQSKFLGQIITIYTFVYNVDQNVLSYYSAGDQSWRPEMIQGYNVNNLNNCLAYSRFNAPNPQPAPDQAAAQPAVDADANNTTPVDADVSVATVPPDMPDYEQPECPAEGYLWQPGYWAYSLDTNGYYWVPGVWVAPPSVGLLWTPPYWGFDGGVYVFHTGYWGNTVGFYGGIDYGYGYGGVGFVGGEWNGGHFRYNTAIVRVNINVVHNTYVDRSVYRERGPNHYSFNGRGGYMARPNAHEMAAMHEHHVMATPEQIRNQRIARSDKSQFAAANGGRPASLAAEKVPARAPNAGSNQRFNGGNTGNAGRPGAAGTPNAANAGRPGAGAPGAPNAGKPGMTGTRGPAVPTGGPGAPGKFGTKSKVQVPKAVKAAKSTSKKS